MTTNIGGVKDTKIQQNLGLYTRLALISLFLMTLTVAPVLSGLSESTVIVSTGVISNIFTVTAESGYWQHIQNAVDEVAASGGGNVYIPAGTHNFVNVGESWTGARVSVPAGVNIFGASTERDADGQVVEWKTILKLPWDVPDTNVPIWFSFTGDGTQGKTFRFSDIQLIGYRYYDPSSTTTIRALSIANIWDFRIDHCYFRDTTAGVWIGGSDDVADCGVIDHCKFINTNGVPEPYETATVGYAIGMGRTNTHEWEDDISNVVGHYTHYTVFVEDCYFEKWRHCVNAGYGHHYILRHSTINDDFGFGSVDAHGTYNYVSTRAIEVYDNTFTNCMSGYGKALVFWRGGGGVFFDNYNDGSYDCIVVQCEGSVEKCWPNQIYIWNNVEPLSIHITVGSRTEGVHYFQYEMPDYTPYPYPHPLTSE